MNEKLNRAEFIELMSQGTGATEIVCEKYDGLVSKIVRKYFSESDPRFKNGKKNAERGIFFAIKNFDKDKVGSDVTYLSIYIISELHEYFKEFHTIHIPDKTLRKIKKIAQVKNDLYAKMGYDPTTEEIGKEMGLSNEEIKKLLNFKLQRYEESLNQRDDYKGDDDSEPPEEYDKETYKTYINEDSKAIKNYIEILPEKEQILIGFRHGIKSGLKNYEIQKELDLSEGQLYRKQSKVKDKLRLIRAMNDENISIDILSQKSIKKPNKGDYIPNPETKKEYLIRVTRIVTCPPKVVPMFKLG